MEPVGEVIVLGANEFEIEGTTTDIEGVRQRFADYIERGNQLGCRFVLRAWPTAGVDAVSNADAVWRLRQYFDVNDRAR